MRLAPIILLSAVGYIAADDAKPLYFPVKEGAKSVREVKVGERTFTVTETVMKVEAKDGKYLVTVEAVDESGKSKPYSSVYEVSEKGLLRVSQREAEGEPLPLLKLGHKEGESWTTKQSGPGGAIGKATYTMGKTEEVMVPAGKYKAIRVEAEIEFDSRITKLTYWFAPGVGTVKLEVASGGEIKQTTVLKSFTAGK